MFSIFGCPMHYGVGDTGLIYSIDYLNNHYEDLNIIVVPEITAKENNLPNLKYLNSVAETCKAIGRFTNFTIQQGFKPLFIAGDHSAVIGSISGSSINYENLGLIWVDAHPDINTDQTTVSGNIHGMPVSALLGLGEPKLANLLKAQPKLKPENIVMLGTRSIDPPEAEIIKELNIRNYTYDDVLRMGLSQCLAEIVDYMSPLDHVHFSFDVDSMDPDRMPGVSVPVASGFNEDDVIEIFDVFTEQLPIVSMDIVEFNAAHDVDHRTSDFVHQLINYLVNKENL